MVEVLILSINILRLLLMSREASKDLLKRLVMNCVKTLLIARCSNLY
jgi:hypothetical protein